MLFSLLLAHACLLFTGLGNLQSLQSWASPRKCLVCWQKLIKKLISFTSNFSNQTYLSPFSALVTTVAVISSNTRSGGRGPKLTSDKSLTSRSPSFLICRCFFFPTLSYLSLEVVISRKYENIWKKHNKK